VRGRDLTAEEVSSAERMLDHIWPLLPGEAKLAFVLEDDQWDADAGVSVVRYRRRDEWTLTTGGRLQHGWWLKLLPNEGQAFLGSPENAWTVIRGGWKL
jgi:hypothetical protein